MVARTMVLGLALALLALPPAGGEAAVVAKETAEAHPAIELTAIRIEPSAPGPETLASLSATIANRTDGAVTGFHFRVEIGGRDVPVYEEQIFLVPLLPGETIELDLYRFWTTETSRPLAADGSLPVVVTLEEALPLELGDEDGVEVWNLGKPITGIDSSRRVELSLTAP